MEKISSFFFLICIKVCNEYLVNNLKILHLSRQWVLILSPKIEIVLEPTKFSWIYIPMGCCQITGGDKKWWNVMFLSGVKKIINLTRNLSLKSPSYLKFFYKISFWKSFWSHFEVDYLLFNDWIVDAFFMYRNSKSYSCLLCGPFFVL